MPPLILGVKIGLYVLMAVSVIAAIGVVTLRSVFHSALALALTLLGVAGIYLALQAEFLAMIQILLYVGAVMTLVIFAVMLTERLGDKTIRQNNRQSIAAFLGSFLFLVILCRILLRTPWPVREEAIAKHVNTADLGNALMGTYVFPFEVISVVLIAALIGAIVIAKRDKA